MRSRMLLLLGVLAALAVTVPVAFGAYAKAPGYVSQHGSSSFFAGVTQDGNHVQSISVHCGNTTFDKSVEVVFKTPRRIGAGGRFAYVGKVKAIVGMTPADAIVYKKTTLHAKLHFVSTSKLLAKTSTSICNKGKAHNWKAAYTRGG